MNMSENNASTAEMAKSDQNLVNTKKSTKRLRWIIGIAFGIFCLIALILAIYFIMRGGSSVSDGSESSGGPIKGLHFDDLLIGKYNARSFNASWSSGTTLVYKNSKKQINEYNIRTGEKRTLLSIIIKSASTTKAPEKSEKPGKPGKPESAEKSEKSEKMYESFEMSADGRYLLLSSSVQRIFRHSKRAVYDIYDTLDKKITPLLVNGEHKSLLMTQWAPVGNGMVFNFENNLYYKPSALAGEIAITNDKGKNVFNGIPDWVYEEEVLSSDSATWFNTDGTMIAFIRFDETPVGMVNIPIYGAPNDVNYQYPVNNRINYPKAGSPNPRVELFTVNLTRLALGQDAMTPIPRPSELNTETDNIITVVHWLNKQNVLYIWMNRIQNAAYIQTFDGVKRTVIYNVESKTGWVDLLVEPFHNRDGTRIALILPQAQGDDGPYQHLCLLSATGTNDRISPPEALTKGKYVVQEIQYWDHSSDIIFFTANMPQRSEVRHLFAIKASVGHQPKCLTCNLPMSHGISQNYFQTSFSTERYIMLSSIGPDIPMHAIYEWYYRNNQVSLKKITDWETNEETQNVLKNFDMPTTEIHTVPIKDSFEAKVLLSLPPKMDRSGKTKYPMIVEVYGGPGSAAVVSKWNVDWGKYLTSNQSIIYAKIDGRGSSLRGNRLMHSVYLKLGSVEIEDQINVTRYLQGKFKYIDADRTAIWGWSYGGYAAAMALSMDKNSVFKCATSVAPVTDWIYYDSIYTERYMSLPTLNQDGYKKSSLPSKADGLRGKPFLLVHGTLDDNVHIQQTMILERELQTKVILFKQMIYADETHSLGGVRPHLYQSLNIFFGECLGIEGLKDGN